MGGKGTPVPETPPLSIFEFDSSSQCPTTTDVSMLFRRHASVVTAVETHRARRRLLFRCCSSRAHVGPTPPRHHTVYSTPLRVCLHHQHHSALPMHCKCCRIHTVKRYETSASLGDLSGSRLQARPAVCRVCGGVMKQVVCCGNMSHPVTYQ
jgi:hypothetical protein